MAGRVGPKLAEIDNSPVWDSALHTRGPVASTTSLERALDEAGKVAASADQDAAVLERSAGRYDVVAIDEVAKLSAPGCTNQLHGGSKRLVGIMAGKGAAVALRPTSDGSSKLEAIRLLFERAGVSPALAADTFRFGLTARRAKAIGAELAQRPFDLDSIGPRMLALGLARDAERAGRHFAPAALYSEIKRYDDIVVLRPDGYLAKIGLGKKLQYVGPVSVAADGLRASVQHLEVGELYLLRQGLVSRVHADLTAGAPVFEPGLEKAIGPVESLGLGATLGKLGVGLVRVLWSRSAVTLLGRACTAGSSALPPPSAGTVESGKEALARVAEGGKALARNGARARPAPLVGELGELGVIDPAFVAQSSTKKVDAAFAEIRQVFGAAYAERIRQLYDSTSRTFMSVKADYGYFDVTPKGQPIIKLNKEIGNARVLANAILHEVRHLRHFSKTGGSVKGWRAVDGNVKEQFATATNIWQGKRLGLSDGELADWIRYRGLHRP